MNRKVLFYRHFKGLSGGHLKVRDYFGHVEETEDYEAQIYFSPDSKWEEDNPWFSLRDRVLSEWRPEEADIWFLAGMDWAALAKAQQARPPVPVINLIQGFRHADPEWPLYEFLHYPAVRICVSHGVAKAIQATGQVNGPIRVIENGIDQTGWPLPNRWEERQLDILVYGIKCPELARKLVDRLAPELKVSLLTKFIPRAELLAKLADARVAVCLGPIDRPGGFLLPALEAMRQQALVISPDCVGNRGFCLPERTCLMPAATPGDLQDAALRALSLPVTERQRIINTAAHKAWHSLERERVAFQSVLAQLDELWHQTRETEAV